jgi:hypothetical protein
MLTQATTMGVIIQIQALLGKPNVVERIQLGSEEGAKGPKQTNKQTNKQTPWPLVRERTIPTFADRGVSLGQRSGSPTVVNLNFLDRSLYFSFK